MKSKLLYDGSEKTWALVFDPGDEVVSTLLEFARQQRLGGSRLTAIGGFSQVTLGYFELDKKEYRPILLHEQVEVMSLVGNIARRDGEPFLHAHVVVGKCDGSAWGGHLLSAHVRPTLEVLLVESPGRLERKLDPATNLPLLGW